MSVLIFCGYLVNGIATHRRDNRIRGALGALSEIREQSAAADSKPRKRLSAEVLLWETALATTPTVCRFVYIVYPVVTTIAFEAFPCHDFAEDGRFLMADVSIVCGSTQHTATVLFAWVAVFVYPIGLLLVTGALLNMHALELQGLAPKSKLGSALGFIYTAYKPISFYWEVVEMGRLFCLVGIAVVIKPGSIFQISLAQSISLIFLVVQHQVGPYKNASDNMVALASSFAIVVFLSSCVIIKVGLLVNLETIRLRLPRSLLSVFVVPDTPLVATTSFSVVLCLVCASGSISVQLRDQRNLRLKESLDQVARRLRFSSTDLEVEPPPLFSNDHHIFLSHVWSTAQDQVRVK